MWGTPGGRQTTTSRWDTPESEYDSTHVDGAAMTEQTAKSSDQGEFTLFLVVFCIAFIKLLDDA